MEIRDGVLVCHSGHTWPYAEGVPDFVGEFPYWGEIPAEHMGKINRLATERNWRDALLRFDSSVVSAAEMILNVDRANWHLLCDLPRESRVLDVGAGMGTNSHALALHYKEVVALEPVLERVKFVKTRFAQEKLENVRVVRGSLWAMPFPPGSFDLVAMNGVLEWVATGQVGDPAAIQQRALRMVHRTLRPGGRFYLGIENRLAWGYFVGYRDPHCELPYVTILPRPLAHWYAKRKGRSDGYRNYLYSSHGYSKLLQRAGFTDISIYLALPSYNHPRFFVPLDKTIFQYYSANFTSGGNRIRGIVRDLLLRLGVLKELEYSFAIIASKPEGAA